MPEPEQSATTLYIKNKYYERQLHCKISDKEPSKDDTREALILAYSNVSDVPVLEDLISLFGCAKLKILCINSNTRDGCNDDYRVSEKTMENEILVINIHDDNEEDLKELKDSIETHGWPERKIAAIAGKTPEDQIMSQVFGGKEMKDDFDLDSFDSLLDQVSRVRNSKLPYEEKKKLAEVVALKLEALLLQEE